MVTFADWNIEEITGYKPISTFYTDLSIADMFGAEGVKDTFNNVFKNWKDDMKMFTEFVMALNWKSWQHSDKGNMELCELYTQLFYKAQNYVYNNWKDEKLSYYIRTVD